VRGESYHARSSPNTHLRTGHSRGALKNTLDLREEFVDGTLGQLVDGGKRSLDVRLGIEPALRYDELSGWASV